jgi:cell division protein FtsA
MRGRHIAAIDVGSTKVCVAVARLDQRGMEIIASGTVPCSGMRKGVVIDIDEAAPLDDAVKEAESVSGVPVSSAYVGISGAHINCVESYGATGIRGKEVRGRDVERVLEAASAIYVPLDRELLHVLASEFVIDGQDGIARPLGMAGVRLEVKVQLITASQAVLENLSRALGKAGVKAAGMVFAPVASALAVLKEEELQHGALLLDLGGGTTDIALYKGNTLRYASVLPVGGVHLTNDLSVGLKLPQKEAERLKRRFGAARREALEAPAEIDSISMNGKPKKVASEELASIIKPRLEEMFELVKADIQSVVLKHPPTCAVMTGGGSMLRGVAEMSEKWLSLPVRTGIPERAKSSLIKDMLREPQYSAAVGLLLYAMEAEGFSAEGGTGAGILAQRLLDGMQGVFSGALARGAASVRRFWPGGVKQHRETCQRRDSGA